MKTSFIRSLPADIATNYDMSLFPSISKHSGKVIDFINGCKYIVVLCGDIYIVNYEIFIQCDILPPNWIDDKISNEPENRNWYLILLKTKIKLIQQLTNIVI